MNLKKEKISESEFMFLMTLFLMGTAVMVPPGRAVGNESWLAILGGAVGGLLFCLIYQKLSSLFPEKNLLEMTETVFGKVLGKICSSMFLLYFLYIGSLSLTIYHSFLELELLNKTPSVAVVLLVLLPLVYAAYGGIEIIARCGKPLIIFGVLGLFMTFLFLINEYDFNNFLPLFSVPILQLVWSFQETAAFPFGEAICFLMFLTAVNRSSPHNNSWRLFILPLLTTTVLLLGVSLRNVGVLGKLDQILIFPGFYLGRILHVSESFTRMEIITIINFVILAFWKMGLLLYCTSLGTAQLFNLSKYRRLIVPIALLMGFIALNNFQNMSQKIMFLRFYYPIIAFVFQLILPLTLLLTAKIRNLKEG